MCSRKSSLDILVSVSTPEEPRKPRRKPGVQPLFDLLYTDYRRRVKRPSGWTTGPDGVEVPKLKRWQVRYVDLGGVQRYESFGDGEKAAAQARHEQLTVELHGGTHIERRKADSPFGQVAEEWKRSLTRLVDLGKMAPSTKDNYFLTYTNHVAGRWAARDLSGIQHTEIQEWVYEIVPTMAAASVHRVVQVFSAILGRALKGGLVRANHALGLELPKIEKEEHRYLDHGQLRRLSAACDYLYSLRANVKRKGRDRAAELTLKLDDDGVPIIPAAEPSADGLMVRFMGITGPRIGEVTALRVKNLRLDTRRVHIVEAFASVGGKWVLRLPKGNKTRTVDLVAEMVPELEEHIKGKLPDDLVFTGPTGAPLRRGNWNKRVLTPAATLAGLYIGPDGESEFTAHDLRHTFASLCASAGVPVRDVALWMGHANTRITEETYTGLFPTDLAAHAALLGAAMSASSN